jgi:hypothetical protein
LYEASIFINKVRCRIYSVVSLPCADFRKTIQKETVRDTTNSIVEVVPSKPSLPSSTRSLLWSSRVRIAGTVVEA